MNDHLSIEPLAWPLGNRPVLVVFDLGWRVSHDCAALCDPVVDAGSGGERLSRAQAPLARAARAYRGYRRIPAVRLAA